MGIIRHFKKTFHCLEKRKDVPVAPAAISQLRPAVIVLGLTAHEDHAVDGAGTTQETPARNGNHAEPEAEHGIMGAAGPRLSAMCECSSGVAWRAERGSA